MYFTNERDSFNTTNEMEGYNHFDNPAEIM